LRTPRTLPWKRTDSLIWRMNRSVALVQ
jgi:hypothetical protein